MADIKKRENDKIYRINHVDNIRKYKRDWINRKRKEVFEYYGGNPPRCTCCGETHREFLCVDHIDGNGNKWRKSIGYKKSIFIELASKGFPPGFRILCNNCNQSIGTYGYCPHKKEYVSCRT